ncbi:MAG: amidohydrolase [Candidatus Atribacteria bacterium]|nr:amidohydrolase [Candidatus Atribacteria bacterium]
MDEKIIKTAKDLKSYIIDKRRDFHMHPELKFEEKRTSGIVSKELISLGFDISKVADTGVIGILKGKDSRTVALRADMDALPIKEATGKSYTSKVEGKMHACGHDGHIAMLLGAARILSSIRENLNGTVKLIFQPAEEGGWGAEKVVESSLLDNIDAIFGMHLWANLPSGAIGVKPGPLMASVDSFKIHLKGKGGHAAEPEKTIDPISALVDMVNAYQKIISREVSTFEPAILSITSIDSGEAFNVIPENAYMLGTVRAVNLDVRNFIIKRMKEITKGYAKAMNCSAQFEIFAKTSPPVINDENLALFAKSVLSSLGNVVEPKMTMIGEDFSFYARKAKTLFLFLGIRNEEKGIIFPHHHPKFDIDEDVLDKGSAIYSLFAYQYLANLDLRK